MSSLHKNLFSVRNQLLQHKRDKKKHPKITALQYLSTDWAEPFAQWLFRNQSSVSNESAMQYMSAFKSGDLRVLPLVDADDSEGHMQKVAEQLEIADKLRLKKIGV